MRSSFLFAVAFTFVCIPATSYAALQNGANAIDVLGQYDDSLTNPQPVYTKSVANNGPNSLGFNLPTATAIDAIHHRLFVSDFSNNRILVYILNSSNAIVTHIPSYVLGQPNLYTNTANTTQSGIAGPNGIAYDSANNRLFVVEQTNNRIIVFDVSTISNGMNASYVLGQADFTHATAATTQATIRTPAGVAYDPSGNRLFVADKEELPRSRVLRRFSGYRHDRKYGARTNNLYVQRCRYNPSRYESAIRRHV